MITFYFTLSKNHYSLSKQHHKRFYVKVIAEDQTLAKDAFMFLHPQGYSGIYNENSFKPSLDQVKVETIKQIIRNSNQEDEH